jgi:hypothetical protein
MDAEMLINFWDCEYMEYDESWDGEDESRYYSCRHHEGTGECDLQNKYGDMTADCKLLDVTPNAPLNRHTGNKGEIV